jgi:hypothetical protein
MKLRQTAKSITDHFAYRRDKFLSPIKQKGFINFTAALSRTNNNGIDRGAYDGKSLVLDGAADLLTWTPSSANDDPDYQVIYTEVKRSKLGVGQVICGAAHNVQDILWFDSTDNLRFYAFNSGGSGFNGRLDTTEVFRDVHDFMGVCVIWDSANATSGDRIRMYVRTSTTWRRVTAFSTATYPSINQNLLFWGNSSYQQVIGAKDTPKNSFFNGYISKFIALDGITTVTNPSDFYNTSADTGKDVLKGYSGSYGTNGFYLDYNNDRTSTPDTTTTLYDQSGNGNNWTGNSLTASSFTNDTPVNNYNTMSALFKHTGATVTNGNLNVGTGSSTGRNIISNMFVSSGKWRWSAKILDTTYNAFGLLDTSDTYDMQDVNQFGSASSSTQSSYGMELYPSTYITRHGGANGSPVSNTTSVNDVYDFFLDLDNGTIHVAQNGSLLNSGNPIFSATEGASPETVAGTFMPAFWVYSGGDTMTINFGATAYDYSAPSGFDDYLNISSANLPVPTNFKPQDNANIVLYTGDGTSPKSVVSGLAFQPDFSWIKDRTNTNLHNVHDVVRGVTSTNTLSPNSTAAEGDSTYGYVSAFNSDGVEVTAGSSYDDQVNDGSVPNDYWSLLIKAGGVGVSNTDGSITSTVSTDGTNFSIVKYTGTGVAATIGHGLATAPDLVIVKSLMSVQVWMVYHSHNTSAPETGRLELNSTDVTADSATYWNDTAPTSSVFSIGTALQVSKSNDNFVAYCFKFGDVFTGGSYIGNGNADGAFIPTDELLMFMCKRTNSANNWMIVDRVREPNNPTSVAVFPDSSSAETTGNTLDFLGNGIKHRTTSATQNASGGTYIWWGVKKDGGNLAA